MHIFKMQLTFLTYVGLWIPPNLSKSSRTRLILCISTIGSLIVLNTSLTTIYLFKASDFKEVVPQIAIYMSTSAVVFRFFLIHSQKQQLVNIFEVLSSGNCAATSVQEEKIKATHDRFSRYVLCN